VTKLIKLPHILSFSATSVSERYFPQLVQEYAGGTFQLWEVCLIDVTNMKAEFMLFALLFDAEIEKNSRKSVNGFN
jgi:hypothetical protein